MNRLKKLNRLELDCILERKFKKMFFNIISIVTLIAILGTSNRLNVNEYKTVTLDLKLKF